MRSPLVSFCWGSAAIFFYFLGSWHHLGLATIMDSSLIFGDDGDGFFNLWVLLHNSTYLSQGLSSWMDGRIFWPDNSNTMFWSDILIGPTLPFHLLRKSGLENFAAYKITIFLLSSAAYSAVLFLLVRFGKWAGLEEKMTHSRWLALFFCFPLVFSIDQLTSYQHFQNLCWFGLVILLFGLGGYSMTARRRYLALALSAEVFLLYSAPYFAVMGAVFCALWILLQLLTVPEVIKESFVRGWPFWGLAALLGLVPVLMYHRVPHMSYSSALIQELATRMSHFWIPRQGLLYDLLVGWGWALPKISHESPAYLGLGYSLLLVGAIGILFRDLFCRLNPFVHRRFFLFAGLALLGSFLFHATLPLVGYILAWIALLSFVVIFVLYIREKAQSSPLNFLAALMLSAALVSFGLALGPNPWYLGWAFNPSIHGILNLLVPGVNNMRAIGRMALVGHVCLGAWLFLEYGQLLQVARLPRQRQILWAILLLALVLQIVEAWPVTARMHRYAVDRIQPSAVEQKQLRALEGVGCVFPTRPWPRNTHVMLYFLESGQLRLINGYSARSTPLLDQLMAAGKKGEEPTGEQLEILRRQRCRYFMVWKRKISRRHLRNLLSQWPLALETNQMVIFKM